MRRGWIVALGAIVVVSTFAFNKNSSALPLYVDDVHGSFVTVEPLLGRSLRPIRVFLSTAERRTLLKFEAETSKVKNREISDDSLISELLQDCDA
jgi:hypothetical protein